MSYPSLAVIGGDARQKWLANKLHQQGALSAVYAVPNYPVPCDVRTLTNPAELSGYTCIVGPVPLARNGSVVLSGDAEPLPLSQLLQLLQPGQILAGGNLSPVVVEQCQARQIITYDFMQSPTLALANAEITAEGMLAILLQETPFILQNASVLLLGYGRCGMLLAQKLQAIGCQIIICEQDAEKRSLACAFGFATVAPKGLATVLPDCELVINTVPAPVLTYELLCLLPSDAMLFEMASAPGGIDAEAAKALQRFYKNCPGLPGCTAPQTAGEVLAQNLLQYLTTIPIK